MATKKKNTAATKKVVKVGSVKVRAIHDIPRYISKKEVVPFNQLSEVEKVRGGYYPPLQSPPNFEKSEEDRTHLNGRLRTRVSTDENEVEHTITYRVGGVHTGRKGPTGSANSSRSSREANFTLIVHLANPKRNNLFKTTYSFQCKPSEVDLIVKGFTGSQKVTKYHYRGKTIANG